MSAVQRSKQRSATGAAAYRSGTRLVDVRTGAEYDYTRRRGVAAAHLIVPGAGIDAVDRQALWSAVEKKHTRGDAVPAREIVVALPCQLDPIDRTALALQYARELADRYGVAVDVAVHLPSIKPGHDQRNDHAHLLMSACSVQADATGIVVTCGKKVEALDPIAGRRRGGEPIAEVERARWAAMCNAALEAAGRSDVTYDHRSYERQGVDQIPQIHLGPDAHDNLLRHQNDPGNVVLLDRTREWLEIEKSNSYLREAQRFDAEVARLEAEIIEMPPPLPRPDKPVEGPSAVVVHLRTPAPEPPPAPDTAAVLAAVARLWHAHDRNNWQPDTTALRALLEAHPALRREWAAELTEREPEIAVAERERQRAIRREAARAVMSPVPSSPRPAPAVPTPASLPVPVPVPVRPAVRASDLDAAIADAEARLAALEERERVRAAAAEAYRRAQSALQAAQAGLWARLRTWVGAGAGAAEIAAREALKAAEQGAKSAGVGIVFGKAVVPVDAERIELQKQLVALRDERGGLVVADAEQRAEWPALRALDAAGSVQQLRDRLAVDPGLAIALAHDLGQRLPDIEALEGLSRTDSGLPGRPEFVRVSRAESVVDGPRGLLAVIEAGPARAWPGHFGAYFAGCSKRGEISEEELQLVAEVLSQLPPAAIEREEVLRLVVDRIDDQAHDEQDDWPAPGA
jgi:hypothetical protein